MNFSFIFIFFLPFTTSFQRRPSCIFDVKKYSISSLSTIKQNVDISTKIKHFKKLIRSESILPTSLLCLTGGFIINPSIIGLLQTPSFLISTINTVWIMSGSMIINDIFDIENDKIDHPDRPLIRGNIKKGEAVGFLIGLLFINSHK